MQAIAKRKKSIRKNMRVVTKIFLTLIFAAGGIISVMPFVWMISASFTNVHEVFSFPVQWIPREPTLVAYRMLFRGDFSFFRFYLNSMFVTSMALIGTFFSCTLAGYAYAKINFRARNKIFLAMLSTAMIPTMVTMLPTFVIYRQLGLVNSHAALWLPLFFGGTFGVMIMRQNMVSIPNEIIEAAKIDGAGHFRIYWNIALPSVKPAIATLLFMYFLWTWNDYERPLLYLQDRDLFTLPFAVQHFATENAIHIPAIMAANVVSMSFVIIMFIFCQKYFVQSVMSAGIKG